MHRYSESRVVRRLVTTVAALFLALSLGTLITACGGSSSGSSGTNSSNNTHQTNNGSDKINTGSGGAAF